LNLITLIVLVNVLSSAWVVICVFVMLVPNLAVTVRRLHDTGRSGMLVLTTIVPIVGFVILFVCSVMESEQGANLYGAQPRNG